MEGCPCFAVLWWIKVKTYNNAWQDTIYSQYYVDIAQATPFLETGYECTCIDLCVYACMHMELMFFLVYSSTCGKRMSHGTSTQ